MTCLHIVKVVVALILSMSVGSQAKPMGYEYPTPSVPFIEGPVSTTSPPSPAPVYDDYDPNDIPADQAAPSSEVKGYEYPVPENPLALPTKPPKTTTSTTTTSAPLPECIPVEERDIGMNIDLLEAGVPLCPDYEDYNPNDIPIDQAPPAPDCILASEQDDGYNPTFLEQGVPLCPEEELPGYEYPVPENPLELPTPAPTNPPTTSVPLPDCISVEESDYGVNIDLLEAGVPLCQEYEDEGYDDYDPEDIPKDQAPPAPDCILSSEQDDGYNPTFLEQGVPLCPEEELPGYEYPVPENPLTLPTKPPKQPEPVESPTLDIFVDYDPEDVPQDQAPPAPDCILSSEKDDGYNPTFLEQGVPLCPEEELPGYEYPVPETPLTLPPRPTTTTSAPVEDPDDYDPLDVPADQAPTAPDCVPQGEEDEGYNPVFIENGVPVCPSSDLPGYQPIVPAEPSYDDYDINDIPADQAAPAPDCVRAEDKDSGPNPGFIASGIPLCEDEGYSYPVPENPLVLPQKKRKSKQLTKKSKVQKMSKDNAGHGKASESNGVSGVSVTDKTPHDSGAGLTLHSSKNGLRNKTSKSNKHQAKGIVKKEKQNKKKKSRAGKSLFNDDSDIVAPLQSESEQEHSSEKKSSGIRTISVREWLRRG